MQRPGIKMFTKCLVSLLGIIHCCKAVVDITFTGDEACGIRQPQVFNESHGHIYSPGYVENKTYPARSKCSYKILAPRGHKIRLRFEDIDIEEYDMCDADQLVVYDGPDYFSKVLGYFCGQNKINDLLSKNNSLYIAFRSDFIGNGRGYHLSYQFTTNESLCGSREVECRNRKCVKTKQLCNGIDDCGDGTDEEQCTRRPPMPEAPTCGTPAIQPEEHTIDRIIGGQEAIPNSWPWQVNLDIIDTEPSGHTCGGALIDEQWVVTAAHCFSSERLKRRWKVMVGNHNKFRRESTEQVRYIERLVVYPGISEAKFIVSGNYSRFHDIALVKLSAPVFFNDYVRPICLPSPGTTLPLGTHCYATGWGVTRGTGHFDVLKQTIMEVLEAGACENELVGFSDDSMVCAGNMGGGHGVCHGDSGGPLVCKTDGQWYLMGVVSFAVGNNMVDGLCAMRNNPAVFCKVAAKVEWIREMKEKYVD